MEIIVNFAFNVNKKGWTKMSGTFRLAPAFVVQAKLKAREISIHKTLND